MKVSAKFGLTAVEAVKLIQNDLANTPEEAWGKAGHEILKRAVYIRKGCPKAAFLGLCEEGLVKGIPRGKYTRSIKNKAYALKALGRLQADPSLAKDPKLLWLSISPNPIISHNYQMNVVISLWKENLLLAKSQKIGYF
ncbi:MAG: hypothetical protein NWF04_01595 [Candidatus Bathyarchaeota archaeon]|nr:hypothetical protein [Candidatus Bathyarchaeota archaeon]